MSEYEVITLKTGERAIRQTLHGEVMHPAVGPWAEANGLYVEQTRLAERLCAPQKGPLRILDVGLGGAANATAALSCAAAIGPDRRPLEMVSLENSLEPLRLSLSEPEGFPFLKPFRTACQSLLENGEWQGPGVHWRLLQGDALESLPTLSPGFELIFFDPFSPSTHPAMWTVETFRAIRHLCNQEAVLATYSAATPTRVTLLLAGFFVGKGRAIGFKSETTVAALSRAGLESPLDARWLERWRRSSARAPHGRPLAETEVQEIENHPQWRAGET